MENQELRRRPNVLIVSGPFQGHLSPMLDLGTVLHSKGFGVIFAHTVFNAPDPSKHPDLIFLPLPENLSDHQILPGDIIALVNILNKNCEEPLKKGLSEIMNQLEPENQVVCIIYDMFMYFSESVAKDLKLHCMIFRTSSASSALAYHSLSRLQAEGYIPRKVFKYDPPSNTTFPHSVYLLRNYRSFMSCDLRRARRLGSVTQGGGTGFELVLKNRKPYYIACGERNGFHCKVGLMKFSVIPLIRWTQIKS